LYPVYSCKVLVSLYLGYLFDDGRVGVCCFRGFGVVIVDVE